MLALHGQSKAANTDHLAAFVDDFDFPYLDGAADVHGPGGAGNEAFVGRANVVGVDFDAHHHMFFLVHTKQGTDAAQRFGEHTRGAAVQQSEGLDGAVVHGHGAGDVVVAYFGNFNTEVVANVFVGKTVGNFRAGFYFPNHGARIRVIRLMEYSYNRYSENT